MKKYATLFLFCLFVFISCKDATTDPEADYPLKPFNTDVIRPLSVGNYWVYNYTNQDTVVSTVYVNVIDSTNKTYKGKQVAVFTIKTENREMETPPSFSDVFVLENFNYHTKSSEEQVITECTECLPYRYIGEAKTKFIEEEYTFDGRTVTAIKNISDDSYFVLGIGEVEESSMPVLVKDPIKGETIITYKAKLVDYHINR